MRCLLFSLWSVQNMVARGDTNHANINVSYLATRKIVCHYVRSRDRTATSATVVARHRSHIFVNTTICYSRECRITLSCHRNVITSSDYALLTGDVYIFLDVRVWCSILDEAQLLYAIARVYVCRTHVQIMHQHTTKTNKIADVAALVTRSLWSTSSSL